MASNPKPINIPMAKGANDDAEHQDTAHDGFEVDQRLSREIVLAFVGPVGSGVSTCRAKFEKKLKDEYHYDVVSIRLSDIIRERAPEVGAEIPTKAVSVESIDLFQNIGNELRKKFKNNYLANRAIEAIALARLEHGGYKTVNGQNVPKPDKRVYLLDSLKHPDKLKRLRQVYGDILWVITVFAPEDVRLRRLVSNGISDEIARHAMNRDLEEEEKSGQKVSKLAHQANYFIRNDSDNKDSLDKPVDRFLETIFGLSLHTPTLEERGMLEAASAAVRSACLSRQVGASAYSKSGQLLGVGCNDVPKHRGGLYVEGDVDNRCFNWRENECHNDKQKKLLAEKIAGAIGGVTEERTKIISDILSSGVGNLIEFSRSVHAEMEAIVSVSRSGSGSLLDGILYTTTFPCHNCARHIVAAGIDKVIYVEPYSKSLALELHSDSITLSEIDTKRVRFLQYQGFAPRTTIRLFSSSGKERKLDGKYVEKNKLDAIPIFPSPLDSYTTSERLIIQELEPEAEGDGKAG